MGKRTRTRAFLEEMDQVVPRAELALIEPHYWGNGSTRRSPCPCEVMLRVHYLQQWSGLSDPAMEEALHDVLLYRQSACLDAFAERMPDESTILPISHLLEAKQLAPVILGLVNQLLRSRDLIMNVGTMIDSKLISAASSTNKSSGERAPDMHQTKRGSRYHFGMGAHIGVNAASDLVHTVVGTPANLHDLTPVDQLLHDEETHIHTDARYATMGKRHAVPRASLGQLMRALQDAKAKVNANFEHPFRVTNLQFGCVNVRYRGLAKNTTQLQTLFELPIRWMMRGRLLAHEGSAWLSPNGESMSVARRQKRLH